MIGKKKALFIDRDGVVNQDCAYPHLPSQIVFNEDVFGLCQTACDKGYIIIVVTNQAGVAKGKFPEADVIALHAWMADQFKKRDIDIAGFF
jgi:D-glycero-D-manno-heptose 1,7-bisphosphate phosphatase